MLLACDGKSTNFPMPSALTSGGACRVLEWVKKLGRGWCCSSHGWAFEGRRCSARLSPYIPPHLAEAAMSVQQLDHWVPVMDLSHMWLSPEGHSCLTEAILSEELECQMQLLFLQYLVTGYNVIPQKEELSWAVQSTDVQLPSQ